MTLPADRTPRIAVLGAGKLGIVLARLARAAGYDVTIAGSGEPESIELMMSVFLPGVRVARSADAVATADLVVLAFVSNPQRNVILEKASFDRYTERTVTDRQEYLRLLLRVQERGWAFDDGEYDELSNCIAAPVRDHTGRVIGAISITDFRTRQNVEQLTRHLPLLLETTEAVSADLGWRADADSVAREG